MAAGLSRAAMLRKQKRADLDHYRRFTADVHHLSS